jgi:CHAD domain-containing protein
LETDNIRLKEIKPALAGYIRDSVIMLKRETVPDDRVIHDVRVLMKKSRAILKLIANQLGKEFINRDIASLREVGRKMCDWRESSVLRKSLRKLKKEFPDIFLQLAENDKINFILNVPDNDKEQTVVICSEIEDIYALLNKTGYRIRFESINRLDPGILLKELEYTYQKVVDIYLICRISPGPEKLHEFRKKAKDFLYQLYFFRPLNPSKIKALEKKLDNLTYNLGLFNNLSQLIKALEYKNSAGRNMSAMDELIIRIREKQDGYLSAVWPAAFKIFCPGQKLANILGFKVLII